MGRAIVFHQRPHGYTWNPSRPHLTDLDLQLVPYDNLFNRRCPIVSTADVPTVVVFTDLERISEQIAQRLLPVWSHYSSAVPVLNHPTRALRRYDLLRALADRGLNSFEVHRLSDERVPRSFPVFLRRENDHAGAQSDLIHTERELLRVVRECWEQIQDEDEWLVVEQLSVPPVDGLIPKYGAFRVGPHIIPRHLMFGDSWEVKYNSDDYNKKHASLEEEYLRSNPHEDELRAIFELANIEFGRIDYIIADGRLQTFEINTNPSLASPEALADSKRRPLHLSFLDRLAEAFNDLGARWLARR